MSTAQGPSTEILTHGPQPAFPKVARDAFNKYIFGLSHKNYYRLNLLLRYQYGAAYESATRFVFN